MGVKYTEILPLVVLPFEITIVGFSTPDFTPESLSVLQILSLFGYRFSKTLEVFERITRTVLLLILID